MEFAASEFLFQQVTNAIVHNPHLNHRKMHLKMNQGKVVLEGQVNSFFEKQMAQEALKNVAGVDEIDNHLEVNWS